MTATSGGSTLIDSLYWELYLRTDALEKGAAAGTAAVKPLGVAAANTEAQISSLAKTILETPAGFARFTQILQQAAPPLDRVAAGMSAAGAVAKDRLAYGMSAAAVAAVDLAQPLDRVAAGMSEAGAAAQDRLVYGMSQAGLAARQTKEEMEGASTASDLFGSGTHKVRAGLVALAVEGTGTNRAIGELVQGLLLFGAGSTLVLGIAAGVAVISGVYDKVTESARKTKEAADAAREAIEKAAQTPLGEKEAQLTALDKQIDALELKRDQPSLSLTAFIDPGTPFIQPKGLDEDDTKELENLKKTREEGQKQINQLREQQKTDAEALTTELSQQVDRIQAAIKIRIQSGLPVDELKQQLADAQTIQAKVNAAPVADRAALKQRLDEDNTARRAAIEQARNDLTKLFVDQLPTTIEATTNAIVQLGQRLIGLGTPATEVVEKLKPLVDQLKALNEQAFKTQLDQATSLGPEQVRDQLASLRGNLVDQLSPDESQNLVLRQRIADIDKANEENNKKLVGDYQQQADASSEVLDNTGGISTNTSSSAKNSIALLDKMTAIGRVAIGIAQALGDGDKALISLVQNGVNALDAFEKVEQSVRDIQKAQEAAAAATNAAEAAAAAQAGQAAEAAKATNVIGLIGTGIGLASSVISALAEQSAEEARSREIMEKNVLALQNLSKSLDGYERNLTGKQSTTARTAVSQLLGTNLSQGSDALHSFLLDMGKVGDIIHPLGLSLQDLSDLAKSVGITLDTTNVVTFNQSLKALQQQLKNVADAAYLDSFSGQMQLLGDRLQVFDVTDPVDKLAAFLDELSGAHGSPALAGALQGLDLSNAGDRQKALKALQDLFDKVSKNQIDDTGLGDLSRSDFENELVQLTGLLKDANQQLDNGQSASFAVDRTITEITGDRIAAILDTQLVYQQNLTVLPEIRDLLASVITSPLPAPGVGSFLGTGTGAGAVIIQAGAFPLTIVIPPGADAAAIGSAAGQAQAAALDRALASISRAKVATSGGVTQ